MLSEQNKLFYSDKKYLFYFELVNSFQLSRNGKFQNERGI